MIISLKISDYSFGHEIHGSDGSSRHINLTVTPNKNEDLELETGETFSYYKRDSNLPFYLTLHEWESDTEEPDLDEDGNQKERCVGVIDYHERIKTDDGVVDDPSQIIGSISIPSKDFEFILENLKQGHVPTGITLEREFSIKDDVPIRHKGHFGDKTEWSNKNKENQMVLCPSSKHLGRLSLYSNRGSGSSWFDVKPLGVDGSSGGSGWSAS